MRDESRDDFGMNDMSDDALELPESGLEIDSGIEVGFDFLDNIESGQAQPGESQPAPVEQPGTPAEPALAMQQAQTQAQPPAAPASRDNGVAISADEAAEFRSRWADIQASFIDEPQRACEQADNLVDQVLKRMTEHLTRDRADLVRKWDRGSEATPTDDLLSAMKGYRAMVDRLLEADF